MLHALNVSHIKSTHHYFSFICVCLTLFIGGTLSTSLYASHHSTSSTELPTCLHVASYAPGYPWLDGIERALKQTLKGKCELHSFYMDSKKVFDQTRLEEIAQAAKNHILTVHPDIVIVSDDNAVHYVLQRHFKDSPLPFVFCGVNKSALRYGLPYKNATGMIELAPTKLLLQSLFKQNLSQTHIAFLTTKGKTAHHNAADFLAVTQQLKITGVALSVATQEDWRKAYKTLQEDPKTHLIILGNMASFPHWDHTRNLDWIKQHNHKLSIATQPWMMNYVAFGMTKSSEEQGHWAGLTALSILKGIPIKLLPITPNQRFNTFVNPELAAPFIKQIPSQLVEQAITFQSEQP
ncbi:MAG: hypothetical protein GXO35_09605 [Gammaproteobacteria bacterium]|nr:hypothetical protein [Gammaproteobacteria bacterium]